MFRKFTTLARDAVVTAQGEARALGHDWIGTEHLLLGLVGVEQGLAAQVLASFDITSETVRPSVIGILGRGEAAGTGQLVFTPRAKHVLELALRESLALGHEWIGTEHLLLGVVAEGEGGANRILEDLGADGRAIRDAVVARETGADPA
jgi:ATP-dependent Clp protease ATP-binding subunit ClpC